MLKVSVSAQHFADLSEAKPFEVKNEEGRWLLDGNPFDGDIVKIRENHWHIIWRHQSYNVELVESDRADKSAHWLINGRHYKTQAQDRLSLLLEGMGIKSAESQKVNHIKAPMPGLIQSVAVEAGSAISKGDNLLVLVAMKMENVIKSPGSGIVKSLKVSAGEIVEKNQVLLEFQ